MEERREVKGEVGEEVELRCEVESNPPATITWRREGEREVRSRVRTRIKLGFAANLYTASQEILIQIWNICRLSALAPV